MNTLERLKELEKAAKISESGPYIRDDEIRDTTENFKFIYALADAWPKLLAVINEAILAYPGIGSLFGDGRGLRKALEDLGVEFEE